MSEVHAVGYEWHNFVGVAGLCQGRLGSREGSICGLAKDAFVHSDKARPEWMKENPLSNDSAINSALDTQIGGDHYKKMPIQPLEFIIKNGLNFCQGSVIKYVTRYKDKNGIEDLKKARHYIDVMIEMEEQAEANNETK